MAQVTLNGSGFFIFDNQISTSQVAVSQNFTANSFTLTLNTLYHTKASDLTIALISPTQTQIIFQSSTFDGSFFNDTYSFSNTYVQDFNQIVQQTPDNLIIPGGNYYSPFTSQNSQGNWALTISDNSFQGNGGLFGWNLFLSDQLPSNPAAVPFEFSPIPALCLILLIHTLARRR